MAISCVDWYNQLPCFSVTEIETNWRVALAIRKSINYKTVGDTYHENHTVEQNRDGEYDGYEKAVAIKVLLPGKF